MEKNLETATAGGTAAVATTVALVGIPKLVGYVKKKMAQFSDEQIEDMKKLQKYWNNSCRPNEREFFGNINYASVKVTDDVMPFHLQFDPKEKLPLMYLQQESYLPQLDDQEWRKEILENCILRNIIGDSISSLCQHQHEMSKKFFAKDRPYDPLNLFIEELKMWLVKLSHKSFHDKSIIECINGRVNYLTSVLNDTTMFQSKGFSVTIGFVNADNTKREINYYLKQIINEIKTRLKKYVEHVIEREDARVHFEALGEHLYGVAENIIKMLFYGFRNTDAPKAFSLPEFANPQKEPYSTTKNYTLDMLLRHLVSTKSFSKIFRLDGVVKRAHDNFDFGSADGVLRVPKSLFKTKKAVTIDNFWIKKESGSEPGILSHFLTKSRMHKLLQACALFERLCITIKICNEFADLASSTGDISVYLFAGNTVKPYLGSLKEFANQACKYLEELKDLFQKTYNTIFASAKNKKATKEEQQWSKNFNKSIDHFTHIERLLNVSEEVIATMQVKITSFEENDVEKSVETKVEFLTSLLKQFNPDIATDPLNKITKGIGKVIDDDNNNNNNSESKTAVSEQNPRVKQRRSTAVSQEKTKGGSKGLKKLYKGTRRRFLNVVDAARGNNSNASNDAQVGGNEDAVPLQSLHSKTESQKKGKSSYNRFSTSMQEKPRVSASPLMNNNNAKFTPEDDAQDTAALLLTNNEVSAENLAEIHQMISEGNNQGATNKYRTLLMVYPNDCYLMQDYATFLLRFNQQAHLNKALELTLKVVKNKKADDSTYYLLANIYFKLNQFDSAITALDKIEESEETYVHIESLRENINLAKTGGSANDAAKKF